MPVSRTRSTARAALARDLDVDAPAGRRVFHRVVDQVGGDLLEPRAIGGDDDVGGGASAVERDALRVGDVAIEIDRARRRPRPARTGSRRSCIAPLSASEMSISVFSITSTRSDSSTQSASASR